MRQRPRKDNNHDEIVKALVAAGASVQSLAGVGEGCPDILAACRGQWYVIEVKDGSKPPSHRQLTEAEEGWHLRFSAKAPVYTVTSVEQALAVIEPKHFTPDSVTEVFALMAESGGFLCTIAGNPPYGDSDAPAFSFTL